MCKKRLMSICMSAMLLSLCSCEVEVHWFEKSTYVPWYYVVVPVVLFSVVAIAIAHICIVKSSYRCPNCGEVFHPKWNEISSWLHMGDSRVVKCPKCQRRGFCPRHKE